MTDSMRERRHIEILESCHVSVNDITMKALALAATQARDEALEEAWESINKWIKHGELPGNGCDQAAQNNGMILASNQVMALKSPAPQRPGETTISRIIRGHGGGSGVPSPPNFDSWRADFETRLAQLEKVVGPWR